VELYSSFPDPIVLALSNVQYHQPLSPLKQPSHLCNKYLAHNFHPSNCPSGYLCFDNYHQEKRRSQGLEFKMVLEYFRCNNRWPYSEEFCRKVLELNITYKMDCCKCHPSCAKRLLHPLNIA
jgi:hypothetical protein